MERIAVKPRENWQTLVEAQGFLYHSTGGPYWSENVGYSFSNPEIAQIEDATNELHQLCLHAVDHIIRNNLFSRFGIKPDFHQMIIDSWEAQDPSVYGRFDLRFDGQSAPKMYEYNADTPTSLLEAAQVQAAWCNSIFANQNQFNSIEERLIKVWGKISKQFPTIYFSSVAGHSEDMGNADYMRRLAEKAGVDARFLFVEEVNWDASARLFKDPSGNRIEAWFKLYPWEWIFEDTYGNYLRDRHLTLIEPAWKVLMSSKAILPILWELFPDHPNLLPAYFSADNLGPSFVQKPIYGREGANITIVNGEHSKSLPGPYGALPSIYQSFCPLPQFSKLYTLIGSWVIDGKASGIGIRESASIISENRSRFVPHVVQ